MQGAMGVDINLSISYWVELTILKEPTHGPASTKINYFCEWKKLAIEIVKKMNSHQHISTNQNMKLYLTSHTAIQMKRL